MTATQYGEWDGGDIPEESLLPMLVGWLLARPDAFDRFYGRYVNDVMMELLDLITEHALISEEKARQRKGYGMPLEVLKPRALAGPGDLAARAVLALIPEPVSKITGPSYARIEAALQTKKKLGVAVSMPKYEPERGKRRQRPEKSFVLAAAAVIALVEWLCSTADYENVVVPTLEALQPTLTSWNELRAARKWS